MKKKIEITTAMLEKMPSGNRACSDAREWFASTYPGGTAKLDDAWKLCANDEWRIWFTMNYLPPKPKRVMGLIYRSLGADAAKLSGKFPELKPFADNVNAKNIKDRADLADLADLADRAKWCAEEIGLESI